MKHFIATIYRIYHGQKKERKSHIILIKSIFLLLCLESKTNTWLIFKEKLIIDMILCQKQSVGKMENCFF